MQNTTRKAKYTRSLNNYVRYSGMAFEMMFIIAAGVFGGLKLDEWLHTKPVFTLVCSLAGMAVAFYIVIKDALHLNQTDHGEKNTD
ncbi:MAG: AtpZ/AtpI family protein [Bacteroidales bacterium]|nr:AtpZ/AtpI family protein [Bacteroidales bacterium]